MVEQTYITIKQQSSTLVLLLFLLLMLLLLLLLFVLLFFLLLLLLLFLLLLLLLFTASDLRTPSEEYEQCMGEYKEAQKDLVESIIEVALTYLPLFHIYSSLIAQLDVLLSFAEVSANSVIPYTRPTLLNITEKNRMNKDK